MNISRLLSFLPLLMLLPAASGTTFLPVPPANHVPHVPHVPHVAHIVPSDLCPLVQIVEHELCDTASLHNASKLSDLCVLLQNYNASFCSKHEAAPSHSSNDVLSILTLKNEFLHAANGHAHAHAHDIHDVCPILNFIDQELCTSHLKEEFQFYPKQLCPLLNFTYAELCS
jgi:hypothetical protein